MAELAEDKSLEFIIESIAEGDGMTSFTAAKQLMMSAKDNDLRAALSTHLTAYQTAKDSSAMGKAEEVLVGYVKDQFALIYVQAFRMGQSYQQTLDKNIFENILLKAKEGFDAMEEEKKEEGA